MYNSYSCFLNIHCVAIRIAGLFHCNKYLCRASVLSTSIFDIFSSTWIRANRVMYEKNIKKTMKC